MSPVTTVIGGKGRIGSRYVAIIRAMGLPVNIYDHGYSKNTILPSNVEQAIICTPTDTHYGYVLECIKKNIPVLCEKPLSKENSECDKLRTAFLQSNQRAFVVCNYRYLAKAWERYKKRKRYIIYDYFNAGNDELLWDACQLIYIDSNATIYTKSPFWRLVIDGQTIPYTALENSYYEMIYDFVREDGNKDHLWTIEDGCRMTKAVLERMKREERSFRGASEIQLDALS